MPETVQSLATTPSKGTSPHMSEHDYLLAWAGYVLAALGCLLVWFRMTGWMWRYLREPLRVLVAIVLFCPTIVDPSRELFAPAVAIVSLDLLFKVGSNAWRAVADLSLYGVIAFVVYLLFVAIRWPLERNAKVRKAGHARTERQAYPRDALAQGQGANTSPRSAPGVRIEPHL
jgi:predicted permease